LFALAQRRLITGSTWAKVAVGLALAGTAFFFCDALITPAISVLGAVEGLEVLNPGLKSGVVPVTIIVIMVLFAYQRHGTASVARLFGPALVINSFGQGALLLELGRPVAHPLYHLVSAAVLPWMVVLATAAAIIASQATISGAFSMARQAVHLDLLPRLRVLQTSAL